MLLKYGYKGEYMSEDWIKQPLFIQSFAPTSLIYISNMTNSPKLFLIDDTTIPTQDTNQVLLFVRTEVFMHVSSHVMWLPIHQPSSKSVPAVQSYYEITSNSYLAFIKTYVVGTGPWKDTIVPPNPKDNCLGQPTDLVARAHALNLQVTDRSYSTAADFPFPVAQISSFLHVIERSYSVSS
jgi:glycerophosphoryl diester phosphodiesterase